MSSLPWAHGPEIDDIPGHVGHLVFWKAEDELRVKRRPWWIVEWQPQNGRVYVIVNADGDVGTAAPSELTRDFRRE